MSLLLQYFAQALLVSMLSPLFVGMVRKVKAAYQGRHGASVLQPYSDLRKLFGKDEIIPEDASWIFRFMPYLLFGSTLVVAAGVPMLLATPTGTLGNLFVFVYTLALGTFFLALAGVDSGSSFGGFGSSREMSFSAIAEAVLLFSLLPLALLAESQNLGEIAVFLRTVPFVELLPVFVAFIGFFIALLAETGRVPVDNPATHLELTMVHEAMILEYSGKRLALIEWASANKLFVFVTIICSVFFPWGLVDAGAPYSLVHALGAVGAFAAKAAVVAFALATIESTMAKLRIFRVPRLLFSGFIIGAVALALITV